MIVEHILKTKGREVLTVGSGASVADVVEKLGSADVGALVVSDDGRALKGIISERDVVRGLLKHGTEVLSKPVTQLMTADVVTCTSDDLIVDLMALMTRHRIRHVPVLDQGGLAGLVSIGDVVKSRLDELQSEADAMRDYIRRA